METIIRSLPNIELFLSLAIVFLYHKKSREKMTSAMVINIFIHIFSTIYTSMAGGFSVRSVGGQMDWEYVMRVDIIGRLVPIMIQIIWIVIKVIKKEK